MTQEVYDRYGVRLVLTGPGTSGGEGTVFGVAGDATKVAKIYHPNRLSDELHSKVLVMGARPPADPAQSVRGHRPLAWVDRVLYRDRHATSFAGFSMPRVDTAVFRQAHAYYDPADRLARFGGAYTWRHLLTAAYNLTTAVAAVHAAGHRVGDLRETNILVAPSSLVTLIDCDSFEIHDAVSGRVYPTRVATGDYLPPELHGVDFRTSQPERYHADLFALAVMLFRFLMLGAHPFQARGSAVADAPTTEAKIVKGLYPYSRGARGLQRPEYAPDAAALGRSLRGMFRRAFGEGHGDPAARPSCDEWLAALDRAGQRLKRCRSNENHWHAGELRACPWCAMARAGRDPFPRPLGDQLALEAPLETGPGRRREHLRTYVRLALADGDLTPEEDGELRRMGAELGLDDTTLATLVERERGRAPARAAAAPARPPEREPASLKARAASLMRPSWWLARAPRTPVLVLAGLGGALAPLVALPVIVLIVLPAMAAAGRTLEDLASGRSARRAALMAPVRFGESVHHSLQRALPRAAPAALLAGGPYAAGVALGSPGVVLRAVGAAFACGWLWHAWFRARPGDRFAARVRLAGDVLLDQRGIAAITGFVAAAAVCAALLLLGHAMWWPLAGPPFGS